MFENLQSRFQDIFRNLTGKAHLNENQIKDALREVRKALLEADVNYQVTRDFCKRIEERATGAEILKGLEPGQQVVKIVNEELTALLGGKEQKLEIPPSGDIRIMMVGLQGSGKTTTCAKLAMKLAKEEGRKPLLCAGDVYRPAAVRQLQVVGEQAGMPVFEMGTDTDPVDIAKQSSKHAKREGNDVVILDTAGRLHVDEDMMNEVKRIQRSWRPTHILFVVDAMVGQDAVNQAQQFNEQLSINGTILTKLDSDTRGGAAISIRQITGKPILYAGVGEKLEDLEYFFPERMASRILGMGDVLSLIEKAQSTINEEEAMQMQQKIMDQTYTFDDFLKQIRQVQNLGGLGSLMSMLPGMGGNEMAKNLDLSEGEMKYVEAIILSMTPEERAMPNLIGGSRKRRIAKGSGTSMKEVNRLLKQFAQTKDMMSFMAGGGKKKGKGKSKKSKMNKKMMKKMKNMRGMFPDM